MTAIDQTTASRLVRLLKVHGPLTTSNLAQELDISVPAVRQHTKKLAEDQIIEMTQMRGSVGRPAQVWSLTASGHRQFPDAHAEMTVDLIASIRDALGDDALDAVIDNRQKATRARYAARIAASDDLARRLDTLRAMRDEEGYMPEVVKAGSTYLFIEHHCPICAAAQSCQGFCRAELELFRETLGRDVSVERVEYLITGDRRCAYRVKSGLAQSHAPGVSKVE